MAAVRPGFRQAMTWLHDWSGLIAGWLLLVIAAAGTLSVWRQELDAWTHPELARGAVDQAAAGQAAVDWLQAHAGRAPAWYLDLADARSPGTLAFWATPDGGFAQRTLSAETGSPDGIRDSLGGEFFYRLHFELQLPYPWGRLLAAAAGEMLLVVLLTGIVAHARIFKDFFTFRTGKGQRSWLDGHVVLGVLALPFHLMIAFTGVVTLIGLFMPWGGVAAFAGDRAALARALDPAAERPLSGRPAPLAPVAPMLRAAEARFGGAGISTVNVVHPGDAAATVVVAQGESPGIAVQERSITFDGVTGRPLASFVQGRPAMRVYDLLYGLHMGRFAGLASRWLYFLSGLMLTGAIATGLVLWTVKRRRPHGSGHTLVEKLNAGVIGGMPAAFAGFLLANRLLPGHLADRAGWEVRIVFGLWAAALVLAGVAPARRSWTWLLGAGALLCLAAVAGDAGLPVRRLPGGALSGDGVASGVDGTLIALAVCLGGAARLLARRRSPA